MVESHGREGFGAKFWDREREIEQLKGYLKSEPNSILFVYGPKSSGKSTLIWKVMDELREEKRAVFFKTFHVYWFDLRGKFLPNVMEIFFSRKRTSRKEKTSTVELEEPLFRSFKVSASVYREIEEKRMDPFEHMEEETRQNGRRAVIAFDEIQMLKGIYMNGQKEVVDALFNFFVRLTKVLHLAHVLVATSDTFFIDGVYTNNSLKNTSEYYLVDFFDDETAYRILVDEGISEEDARYVVDHIEGVPWMMERIISSGNVKEKVVELYKQSLSRRPLERGHQIPNAARQAGRRGASERGSVRWGVIIHSR